MTIKETIIKWRENKNKKYQESTEILKTASTSYVITKEILNRILDIISWIIIAYFIYIWWQTMGQPIHCERITTEVLEKCGIITRNAIGI